MYIITKDYIDDGESVGTVGPEDISDSDEVILRAAAKGKKPQGIEIDHFVMYDADNERYYAGYHIGDDPFEPLDSFGTPNAGCTSIHMRDKDGDYSEV